MYMKGGKMSQNMPQHLLLNTKHVSTYVILRHFVVTFPSLSSSFCDLNSVFSVWGLMEAGGMRPAGCQALCWKRSYMPTCLSTHVATSSWLVITYPKQLRVLLCTMVAI